MLKKTLKTAFLLLSMVNSIGLFASDAPWTEWIASLIPGSAKQIPLPEIGFSTQDLRTPLHNVPFSEENIERLMALYYNSFNFAYDDFINSDLGNWTNLLNPNIQNYLKALIQYALLIKELDDLINNYYSNVLKRSRTPEALLLINLIKSWFRYEIFWSSTGKSFEEQLAHAEQEIDQRYIPIGNRPSSNSVTIFFRYLLHDLYYLSELVVKQFQSSKEQRGAVSYKEIVEALIKEAKKEFHDKE